MTQNTPGLYPDFVADGFHLRRDATPKQLGAAWDFGWQVGDAVVSKAARPDRAGWSARVRETLQVEGVRIARPQRSAEGRFLHGGWRYTTFVPGILTRRIDETAAAALRLDEALSVWEVPEHFLTPDTADVFSVADFAAWDGLSSLTLDEAIPNQELVAHLLGKTRHVLDELTPSRALPKQVCHADMLGTTIYAGTQPPAVTDLVGVARPYGYTAALAMVDAVALGATTLTILDRFTHIPHLPYLMLRALMYRLYVHALHPGATSNSGTNLEWVTHTLCARLGSKAPDA